MALFGKKPAEAPKPAEDAEADDAVEVTDESSVELKKAELAPKAKSGGGILGLAIGMLVITGVAAGGGMFLGSKTATTIEMAIAHRDAKAAKAAAQEPASLKRQGGLVIHPIEAVVTNLASPSDVWIRLETAMMFKAGAIENPDVTAAELRQDMVAYLRTVTIERLEGPSAFQHLHEDLNERAALRTGGKVGEVVIQSMVIQ